MCVYSRGRKCIPLLLLLFLFGSSLRNLQLFHDINLIDFLNSVKNGITSFDVDDSATLNTFREWKGNVLFSLFVIASSTDLTMMALRVAGVTDAPIWK